ncbi:MAG: DUF4845 domain-containing protein [Candidatus Competibacteraceae bacterium]|jgi:hypothetical protein|nr:DUF4845 domain-containing protein [Candidatus Competibacteraceae bacterium]
MKINKKILSGSHQQRGITVIASVLILIIIAFVALIGMRIIPIYLEYSSIVSILDDVGQETNAKMANTKINRAIEARFDIDYVTVIKSKDVKIKPKGGTKILELIYEDRRPLIGNLDIVAKFEKTVTLNP